MRDLNDTYMVESSTPKILTFENSILSSGMPIDNSEEQTKPRAVKGANFSRVTPTAIENPYVASVSSEVL